MGDADWYQVQLVAGTTYSIRMNGSTVGAGTLANPYVYLHNSAGTQVGLNDDGGGNANSLLNYRPIMGGFYYISARDSGDNSIGTYQLSITGPTTTDAGNTRATATALTLGNPVSQSVGISPDSDDFFSFTAASSGRVTANLIGLSADIDLRALNSSGGQIEAGTNYGTANESFGFNVVAGQIYYLHIDPWQAVSSTYSLTTSFVPTPTPTMAAVFSSNGGQLATLSSLAQAAYDLALGERDIDGYNEGVILGGNGFTHTGLTSVQPRWLTPTDLPTLAPTWVGGLYFPNKGLLPGGVYVNGNASALVVVTTDALFLTFRGTNDNATGVGGSFWWNA